MTITVERTETELRVQSPYEPEFVDAARNLGGRWDKPWWIFDLRDDERVHTALATVYGWHPPTPGEPITTVELTVSPDRAWAATQGPLTIVGQELARAFGRDSGAELRPGVIITKGKVRSGGSARYWATYAAAGTVFELRDLPRSTADAITAAVATDAENTHPKFAGARLIDSNPLAERKALEQDVADLEARLASLRARLAALPAE